MRLMILGAGQYGLVIEDIAIQTNRFTKICFLDDHAASPRVIGKCADYIRYIDDQTVFHVAFGNNESRADWCRALKEQGAKLINIVHPTAYISPTAVLGTGIAVLPMAIINSNVIVRDSVLINNGAIVDHDCVIGEYAHICVGAIVKANNYIPAKAKVEAGEVILNETYPK